jgi:hypothetical protein
VSLFATAFDAVSAAEPRKFPAVEASHRDTCEIVSDPTDHDVHDTDALIDFEPADAADHDSAFRVVSAEAADAPDAPGSPVCSFTYTVPS